MSSTTVTVPGLTGIRLTIGAYSLLMQTFGNFPGQYPRTTPQWATLSTSARGATGRRNTTFYPKAVWTFESLLTKEEQGTLEDMFAVYWANKTAFLLEDYTQPFKDAGIRTRAIAAAGVETTDGTVITYPAQFFAEPTQGITYNEFSKAGDVVSLQFQETDLTTP